MITYAYEINPRPAEIGGGWCLRLIENGQDVGGGVFPITGDVTEGDAYSDALSEAAAWMESRK